MRRFSPGRKFGVAVLAVSTLALGACRESEQDRFIMFEPGVYKGNPDQVLTEEQEQLLRNRTTLQLGANIGSGAIGKVKGEDARPPD